MESEKIRIVSVVNDFDFYKKVVNLSPCLKTYQVCVYDNTKENIGISERYNDFITKNIAADSDFWVIFCHQDFGFFEDPYDKLKDLDKNCVYGVIAPKNGINLIRILKSKLVANMDYYPSIKIDIRGLIPFSKHKFIEIRKKPKRCRKLTRELLGQINQGNNNFDFQKNGIFLKEPTTVSTVDCCCIIVHSSLIFEHNLRFDENLKWHMYAEDFCINARRNYGILTKVVQLDCFHTSTGNLDNLGDDFYNSADYIKKKYNIEYINSTCID